MPDLPPEDHRRHGLADGLAGLMELMHRLRRDCPWDREQSLDSLRPYVLEEAYEVLESMHDPAAHRRELGDLLFQIVFHTAIREEQGEFGIADVIESIRSKMIRRHPHVFLPEGQDPATVDKSPETLARQWVQVKAREREAMGMQAAEAQNPLQGVPAGLPALQRAWRLQDKAAAVGFDWPNVGDAMAKVDEEIRELKQALAAGDAVETAHELGDVLFVIVRVAQKLGIEPEDALRYTNAKFERRFAHVLARCQQEGIAPEQAGLERLDGFWNEAKAEERAGDSAR